jgi:hypothetical protein
MIDLRRLIVEKNDVQDKTDKFSVEYGAQPSRGTPRGDIKSSTSRAEIEPKALLRDLGIQKLSGSNSYEKLASALNQAINNNKVFASAFGNLKTYNMGEETVVTLTPYTFEKNYPQIYIGAILLALQNIDALPNDIDPVALGKLETRNIRQANDGLIVIAPVSWHAKQPRKKQKNKDD